MCRVLYLHPVYDWIHVYQHPSGTQCYCDWAGGGNEGGAAKVREDCNNGKQGVSTNQGSGRQRARDIAGFQCSVLRHRCHQVRERAERRFADMSLKWFPELSPGFREYHFCGEICKCVKLLCWRCWQ